MSGKFAWILVLALLSSPAFAQQTAGSSEFQLQGSLDIDTSGDVGTSGSVTALWGRFLTDHHQIGASAFALVFEDDVFGFGGPFYRYNFSTEKTVPYLGAAAATSFGESGPSDDLLITLEAGVRYFLDRDTAFSVAAVAEYGTDSQEFSDRLRLVFGFSRLWGGSGE